MSPVPDICAMIVRVDHITAVSLSGNGSCKGGTRVVRKLSLQPMEATRRLESMPILILSHPQPFSAKCQP